MDEHKKISEIFAKLSDGSGISAAEAKVMYIKKVHESVYIKYTCISMHVHLCICIYTRVCVGAPNHRVTPLLLTPCLPGAQAANVRCDALRRAQLQDIPLWSLSDRRQCERCLTAPPRHKGGDPFAILLLGSPSMGVHTQGEHADANADACEFIR